MRWVAGCSSFETNCLDMKPGSKRKLPGCLSSSPHTEQAGATEAPIGKLTSAKFDLWGAESRDAPAAHGAEFGAAARAAAAGWQGE